MVDADRPQSRPFSPILSTSLLDDIWSNALDPAYRAATDARVRGEDRRSGRRLLAVVLTSAVIGTAVAAGATQVHRTVVSGAGTKTQLVAQIDAAERASAALSAQESVLRDRVAADRDKSLAATAAGDRASTQLQTVSQAAGETAVAGPGVTIRLVDGSPAAPTSDGVDPALVTDVDIRQVVNAVWAAGAEAVAVNGLRLGPETAIRTAGSAVLVDFRPVESPYVVSAIGAPNPLETGYASSTAAQRLSTLAGLYGIGITVSSAAELHLPGVTEVLPDHASPIGGAS